MEGLFIRLAKDMGEGQSKDLKLLGKKGDLEIMRQHILKDAVAWLRPAEESRAFEFYFVLNGCIELSEDDTHTVVLCPGDSFTVTGLKQNVLMRCTEECDLMCVTDAPMFDEVTYWREKWLTQLHRIDEKDHYTLEHSRAVMQYAVKLCEELKDYCPGIDLNDFVMAALFHDIGKINIPSAILEKPTCLTNEEYDIMKQHPAMSKAILEPIFGERLANLAGMHHERLDGSGYPQGIKGEQIPFEVRILMVVDAFDAMTRDRVYRKADPVEKAADELCSMPWKYDQTVTETLRRMIREGKIVKYSSQTNFEDII